MTYQSYTSGELIMMELRYGLQYWILWQFRLEGGLQI